MASTITYVRAGRTKPVDKAAASLGGGLDFSAFGPRNGFEWHITSSTGVVNARASYTMQALTRKLVVRRQSTIATSVVRGVGPIGMATVVVLGEGTGLSLANYKVLADKGLVPGSALGLVEPADADSCVVAVVCSSLGSSHPSTRCWVLDDTYMHSDVEAICDCESDVLRMFMSYVTCGDDNF